MIRKSLDPSVEPRPSALRRRLPWVGAAILLLLLGLAWLRHSPREIQSPAATPSAPGADRVATAPPAPPPVQVSLGKRTLEGVLRAAGLAREETGRLIQAFRGHLDFRRLQPGDTLELHHDQAGALVRAVYTQSPLDIVEAEPEGDAWAARRREVQAERRVEQVAGSLKDNLFESIERQGERPQLVIDFAEIFAWDFDFASDSQTDDQFRMLVEKIYVGGEFVKYGRILAAEYQEAQGKLHTGIYFKDRESGGYYTPEGESLRRSFLKSPMEFSRITSGYSRARRHPVLGGVRPHLAVDYAAPTGTPVWAVADGTVEYVGWKGGNGKSVLIRHRANFKTMYNHLSRFGKGIRAGSRVSQRQVIGYVGSTGLSTGPHLDYRVMKDGKFVNPLKQTFLPGAPIATASRASFAASRDDLLQQLRGAPAAGRSPS